MIWFALSIILGVLAAGFILNGIRNAFLDEMLVGAVLAVITYFALVKAGVLAWP